MYFFLQQFLNKENIFIKLINVFAHSEQGINTRESSVLFYQSKKFSFMETKCVKCYSLTGNVRYTAKIKYFIY